MIMESAYPLELYDAKSYLKDLVKNIEGATTRVNLISLVFEDDAYTHELIGALTRASQRGVVVAVAVDVFTYGEFGGYFSPFQRFTSRSRAVSAMTARLEAAGVTFTWLGSNFKLNPFGGVTHLKWAVIDDITYCFGGVNLYKEGIESVDYMLRAIHPAVAEMISDQQNALITSKLSHIPYAGHLSETVYGIVYIDSGKPHDSIIYNRLVALASQATSVLVVTQYCPTGPLARHLINKSETYYNQPSRTPFPASLLIKYGEARTGIRSQYKRSTYLHAKFMIFTMPSGKKVAMTGSHNFSYSGVLFGTREVALETRDLAVIKQLEQFHKEHVA